MALEELSNCYVANGDFIDEVNERLALLDMSKQECAKKIKIHRTTVSRYLNRRLQNQDVSELEKKLREFMEDTKEYVDEILQEKLERGKNVVRTKSVVAPQKPTLTKIENYESHDYVGVIGLCHECQMNIDRGIIIGESGFGKTHALKKYATLPRVIYIECNDTMNPKDIVRRIERKIGMPTSYGSIDERVERITDYFMVNSGYLLIVDEADKLISKYTIKKMELFRTISDSNSVGLVLAGEPILKPLIKKYDKRFTSRITYCYELKGLTYSEVEKYLINFEIDDKALEELALRALNKQTGCFRLLDRTLNNVIRILKQKNESRITIKILNEASNMMLL